MALNTDTYRIPSITLLFCLPAKVEIRSLFVLITIQIFSSKTGFHSAVQASLGLLSLQPQSLNTGITGMPSSTFLGGGRTGQSM